MHNSTTEFVTTMNHGADLGWDVAAVLFLKSSFLSYSEGDMRWSLWHLRSCIISELTDARIS